METKQLRIMENVISRVAKAAKFHQVVESLERPRKSTICMGSASLSINSAQDCKMHHMDDSRENPNTDYYVFVGGYTFNYPMVVGRN